MRLRFDCKYLKLIPFTRDLQGKAPEVFEYGFFDGHDLLLPSCRNRGRPKSPGQAAASLEAGVEVGKDGLELFPALGRRHLDAARFRLSGPPLPRLQNFGVGAGFSVDFLALDEEPALQLSGGLAGGAQLACASNPVSAVTTAKMAWPRGWPHQEPRTISPATSVVTLGSLGSDIRRRPYS
ncbi:MAG: hypothetical protein HY236_04120 [Acidobacteria bacterium]|nr:hypothetical protein [Acidobacteriota bacterium]